MEINEINKAAQGEVLPLWAIAVKLIFVKYRYSIIKLIFIPIQKEVKTPN